MLSLLYGVLHMKPLHVINPVNPAIKIKDLMIHYSQDSSGI